MFRALVKLGFTLGLSILSSLYYGWALMTIWGWFFVGLSGFAAFPYAFWVGVPFLWEQLTLLKKQKPKPGDEEEETWRITLVWFCLKVIVSLLGLGFAWLLFMIMI